MIIYRERAKVDGVMKTNNNSLKNIKQKAINEHIPIIMDDTLFEIAKRMKKLKPTKILEIGTAVGYSAICFSELLEDKGKIDTIERDIDRANEAIENINPKRVFVERGKRPRHFRRPR